MHDLLTFTDSSSLPYYNCPVLLADLTWRRKHPHTASYFSAQVWEQKSKYINRHADIICCTAVCCSPGNWRRAVTTVLVLWLAAFQPLVPGWVGRKATAAFYGLFFYLSNYYVWFKSSASSGITISEQNYGNVTEHGRAKHNHENCCKTPTFKLHQL